jgi:uncharacterized protein (DUF1501 family)
MIISLHHQSEVAINRQSVLGRRDFLRAVSLTGAAAGLVSWSDMMALQAAELRKQGKACILLWLGGAPSQFETFDPKPKHANGGETKVIETSVPGIQIADNLPHTAQVMDKICLIRSMNSREGAHARASYLMHTGYLPTASVKYPTLGANVTQQLADPDFDLPSFVRIGNARGAADGGLLGVEFNPFVTNNAARPPENTTITTTERRYQRRLGLLGRLDKEYASKGAQQEVENQGKLYDKAAKMVLSPSMSAFDIQRESKTTRTAYGESPFSAGCLLARRLVEFGVTFVEVNSGGWDTHFDNVERTSKLCSSIDQPYAALLRDLDRRGMLENTMVVLMGEFGRTPKINARGGRDHYPRAFSAALAGGGVQGGQVIGKTSRDGASITDRPVGVSDLLQTICHGLGVDPDHENMSSIGRPIKIVDGGEVVREVFA